MAREYSINCNTASRMYTNMTIALNTWNFPTNNFKLENF